MAIPYNQNLSWDVYKTNPDWHNIPEEPTEAEAPSSNRDEIARRAVDEAVVQTFKQTGIRGLQFIRDAARLVLKVPVRAILTPVVLPKNWKERERAKINAKLTGNSFVQLLTVPAKFCVALAALATSAVSWKKAQNLLDMGKNWTTHLDGRASQLEALKEEGRAKAENRDEYAQYKHWLYRIDPTLCR